MKKITQCIWLNALVAILLSSSLLTTAQVTINPNLPKSGQGGSFIANHNGPNSIFFAPPFGENMHQTYFHVCLERIQEGDLEIRVQYEELFKLPARAAYKFDDGDWQYTPQVDTGLYIVNVPKHAKRCHFASGKPFSYGDLMTFIDTLDNKYVKTEMLERKSLGGRDVPYFKISNHANDDEHKQLVWLISGQHAYELPGIHTVMEMIQYLISDDPVAISLRNNTIFYVCPIVDVDASDMGLSGKRKVGRGTNACPIQDFNWDWNVELNSNKPVRNTQGGPNAYNNISNPQVKALQDKIYATSMKNPLRFFIDSHSPWPDKAVNDTSALHFIDKYLPQSTRSYQNPDSYARMFWNRYEKVMGFSPVALTDETPGAQTSAAGKKRYAFSYGPDEQYDYERSADYWVDSENALFYRNTLSHPNIFFSTTLETGWNETPKDKEGQRKIWNDSMISMHAQALCMAMYDLLQPYTVNSTGDIIIDVNKNNKALQFNGRWNELDGMLPNTPMHFYEGSTMTTSQTGDYVRIPLNIPYSGIFDIYNWHNPIVYSAFEPKPNHILNDPKVQITIFNGEEYYYIQSNQTIAGGTWKKITSLYLYNDKLQPYIEIKKVAKDNKVVQADAIRLSPALGIHNASLGLSGIDNQGE